MPNERKENTEVRINFGNRKKVQWWKGSKEVLIDNNSDFSHQNRVSLYGDDVMAVYDALTEFIREELK